MKEGNFMRIALIQMKANDIKDYEKCAEHILKMINYAAHGAFAGMCLSRIYYRW